MSEEKFTIEMLHDTNEMLNDMNEMLNDKIEMLHDKIKEKMENYWEMYEVIEFLCRDCLRFRKPEKWRCRACRAKRVLKRARGEE